MKPSRAAMLLLCAAMGWTMIATGPAAAQKAQDITVTEADNGKAVTLLHNQTLIVRLPVGLGTGYGWWALMDPKSPLAFAQTQPAQPEQKQAPGASPMVGGQQDRLIAFRAVRSVGYPFPLMLIYCNFNCDLNAPGTKIYRLRITTKK